MSHSITYGYIAESRQPHSYTRTRGIKRNVDLYWLERYIVEELLAADPANSTVRFYVLNSSDPLFRGLKATEANAVWKATKAGMDLNSYAESVKRPIQTCTYHDLNPISDTMAIMVIDGQKHTVLTEQNLQYFPARIRYVVCP